MKKIPLLPRYFQWIGIVLLLLFTALYIYLLIDKNNHIFINMFAIIDDSPFQDDVYFGLTEVDPQFTVLFFLLMVGLAFVAFARKKTEDEMIQTLRLYSWSWSILIMIILALIVSLFFFGISFLTFLSLFGHCILLLFILIFNINLYKMNRGAKNEE